MIENPTIAHRAF